MFVAELEHPDFARFDLTSLRTGIMSGAPCPLPLMEKVVDPDGHSGDLHRLRPDRGLADHHDDLGRRPDRSPGRNRRPSDRRDWRSGWSIPRPAREIAGGPAQTGELCVRGHCVMAGYYNNPEATARAIDADGWLHTGDLARRRDDGNYRIVGRSKELIIRGGENIYPSRGRGVPAPAPVASPRSRWPGFPTPSTARSSRPGSSPSRAQR